MSTKRYMYCPQCRTHTNQSTICVEDNSFKWKCDVCNHVMKKIWSKNDIEQTPYLMARSLLYKCQMELIRLGMNENDPLMKEIRIFWEQTKSITRS